VQRGQRGRIGMRRGSDSIAHLNCYRSLKLLYRTDFDSFLMLMMLRDRRSRPSTYDQWFAFRLAVKILCNDIGNASQLSFILDCDYSQRTPSTECKETFTEQHSAQCGKNG
jgi:hypothetical protein